MNIPGVNFLWPEFLWLLLLLPVLVLWYMWLLKRRKKMAVSFSSLSSSKLPQAKPLGAGICLQRFSYWHSARC
jgi:Ca-activated chloride channel homolog